MTEKAELDKKRTKLTDFIGTNKTYRSLDASEQSRLNRQLEAMVLYSNILGERIAAFAPNPVVGTHVEWEIVLSGGHPDIFVIVSAPENATDAELQSLAETEAMAKTYIWSKKRVWPKTERPS